MFLISFCSCPCSVHWSHVLSREWRCSWSSPDRRCSNYIWVIDNFIAYLGATNIRGFTVVISIGKSSSYFGVASIDYNHFCCNDIVLYQTTLNYNVCHMHHCWHLCICYSINPVLDSHLPVQWNHSCIYKLQINISGVKVQCHRQLSLQWYH